VQSTKSGFLSHEEYAGSGEDMSVKGALLRMWKGKGRDKKG
jgi:hypothetical protein